MSKEQYTFNLKKISKRFNDKVSISKEVQHTYRDEEVFKLYQRVFNLANFGSYVVEQHQTYLVSPFLDDDFIKIALSIHPRLKYNQAIYIDWITERHPEITKYKWERTGFRPNKKWKTSLSKYTNKLKKEFYSITNQQNKLSMNPSVYWFETNPNIQEFYQIFFQSNIELVSMNNELFNDLKGMYNEGKLTEKILVLTLLAAINKFKLKV